MKDLDKHLVVIQEDELQEQDIDMILGATAVAGTAYLIASLGFFLLATFQMQNALKIDKDLTDRMNTITGTPNHWIVHIYPDPKTPNAFALGRGKHMFITTGLLKLLEKREVEAVLLHEIHHNKNKDAYKSLAYKHSFAYLVIFIALTAGAATAFPAVGFLAFLLMNKIVEISHALVLGRHQELSADRYTVQFGYGKDLISAFKKIDKFIENLYRKRGCNSWCRLERKMSGMIDEHPSTKKRVETVLRTMEKFKGKTFTKIKDLVARTLKQNG